VKIEHAIKPRVYPLWTRCLFAAFIVSVALVLRLWLLGGIGPAIPYLTFYPAVMIASVIGGMVSGFLATGLSAVFAIYFFIEPTGTFTIEHPRDILGVAIFIVSCVIMTAVGEFTLRTRLHLQKQSEALEKAHQTLQRETSERMRIDEELRNADFKLRKHLERQSVTLQAVGDGIIAVDSLGIVELLNPVAEQLTGWPQAEAIGKPVAEVFHIVNEETKSPVANPLSKVLERGVVIGLANHTLLISKSGLEIPIADSAAPIFGSSGEIIGAVLVFRDQTVGRRAEQALQDAAEKALMQADLSEASNKAKSIFLANMSHEIRTPLNGILGMLQLLETTPINGKQKEFILLAIRSSKRLTRLLSDILDLSRVEAGKLKLEEFEFEVKDQKDSLIELFTTAAQQKGLDLDIIIDDRVPPKLIGDSSRLKQVLFNLVGNAIKFTDKGFIRLEITLLPKANYPHCRLLFTVVDSGIGIPKDRLADIYDPFVQVEGTYIRGHQGAGLGLSIVKRLVVLMDGEISIDSVPGEGTTISLSLPFNLPVVVQKQTEQHPQAFPSAVMPTLRVLFVEDDEACLISGEMMLKKLGNAVTTATNGKEALGQLSNQDFDVILMDIQMPVMDGVEATKLIRTSGSDHAKIPIIAMTAYAMAGDKEKFLAAGMDYYLAKPVDMKELKEVLEEARSSFPSNA